MQHKTRKLLIDMKRAADFIAQHAAGVDLASYVANEFLRLAVERQFEIIGESARRIAISDPAVAVQIPGLPRIVAFRNVIAHGYDEIDHERVLGLIAEELPELRARIDALLGAGC